MAGIENKITGVFSRKQLETFFYQRMLSFLPEDELFDRYFGLLHSARVLASRSMDVSNYVDPLVDLVEHYDAYNEYLLGADEIDASPIRFSDNALFFLGMSNHPDEGVLSHWTARVFDERHRRNQRYHEGVTGLSQLSAYLQEYVAIMRMMRLSDNFSEPLKTVGHANEDLLLLVRPPVDPRAN